MNQNLQQMMEMQTAQFYQQYMSQYTAMVNAYDARIADDPTSSGAGGAGAAPAASPVVAMGSMGGTGGAGEVPQPALPQEQPKALTVQDLQQQIGDLEEQLKETEIRTKRAATLSKHFVGIIDRFDTKKGHGFVACAETYAKYQQDIFIDRESFQGARVGDTVVFSLGFNKKGAVRACDVRKLKEVSRLKEELDEKRTQLQYLQAAGAGGMTMSSMLALLDPTGKGSKGKDGKNANTIFAKKKDVAGWEVQRKQHEGGGEDSRSSMIYAGKRSSDSSSQYSLSAKRPR